MSQDNDSIFISSMPPTKNKKYLQKSKDNKYPMRKCKYCNIEVRENYLSLHKRTIQCNENKKKYHENNPTLENKLEVLEGELDELNNKIISDNLFIETEKINNNNKLKELEILNNEKETIMKRLKEIEKTIKDINNSILDSKNDIIYKESVIENSKKELEQKTIIYNYLLG